MNNINPSKILKSTSVNDKIRSFLALGKSGAVFNELSKNTMTSKTTKRSVFINSEYNRGVCCERLGIAPATFNQHLRTLLDYGFIVKEGKGMYKLDYDITLGLDRMKDYGNKE